MQNLLASDLDAVLSATKPLWEELRDSRIFITGGTGWFGCWLLESFAWANRALNLNANAVVLTRNRKSLQDKAPHLASDHAIELHVGDIRDFDFPNGKFSHVIHAATEADAKLNAEHPEIMLETIVAGTQRCLEFACHAGVKKFLLTSSGAVYGPQPSNVSHVPETFSGGPDPLNGRSAYAEGKRLSELQCVLAAKRAGHEVKIARCFAFVGPYMRLDSHFAIGNFIGDQLENRTITLKGDGSTVRSYLYMADLTAWLWTILFSGKSGRAYNVGSEDAFSMRELADLVSHSLDPHVPVRVEGKPTGAPVDRYVPATQRAREELGLEQTVSLSEAIRKTAAWYRQVRSGAAA